MKRVLPWLLLIVVLAGFVSLWSSRVGALLRLKYGYSIKNDAIVLDALTQLERSHKSVSGLTTNIGERIDLVNRQLSDALATTNRLIEADPEDANLFVLRSRAFESGGLLDEAIADMHRAKQLVEDGSGDRLGPNPIWCGERIDHLQRLRNAVKGKKSENP